MKLTLTKKLLSALGIILTFTCCSEEDYTSRPPVFSEITIHSLEEGTPTVFYAGDKIVATAVQTTKGHLLNKTTYQWIISPTEGVDYSQKYQSTVIYDVQSENPTDTIVINTPGEYNITFKAKYNASGTGQLSYPVSITKNRIKILQPKN